MHRKTLTCRQCFTHKNLFSHTKIWHNYLLKPSIFFSRKLKANTSYLQLNWNSPVLCINISTKQLLTVRHIPWQWCESLVILAQNVRLQHCLNFRHIAKQNRISYIVGVDPRYTRLQFCSYAIVLHKNQCETENVIQDVKLTGVDTWQNYTDMQNL